MEACSVSSLIEAKVFVLSGPDKGVVVSFSGDVCTRLNAHWVLR